MRLKITSAVAQYVTLLTAAVFAAANAAETTHIDADVLATIDGEPAVTWYDVYFYYRDAAGTGPMAEISAKEVEDTVDTLVTAEIILREAEEKGYADKESFRNGLAGYRRKLLREMLGEALARDTTFTEEEIRSAYEKDTTRRLCSVIVIQKREDAETAYAELAAGRPWDEVENKYSVTAKIEAGSEYGTFALPYDGTAAAEAVYGTPVGGYAVPVTTPFDIAWYVYRVEGTVPGRRDTFEEARAEIEKTLVTTRTLARMEHLATTLRTSSNITRSEEAWRDLRTLTFAALIEKWQNAEVTVSEVGGMPIKGYDFASSISDYFGAGVDGVDAYKAKNSEDYLRAAERLLERLEDSIVLELEARRRGIDEDPEFAYRYKKYRASILTDHFSTKEFKAKLPDITDADVERYYETHKEEFAISEHAEVYLLVASGRDDVEALRARIARADDPVETAASHAAGRAVVTGNASASDTGQGEFYGVVKVMREPRVAEEEHPLAADLRPRVFPFAGANQVNEVFQTADGRWAFYVSLRYEASRQQTLEDPGVEFECSRRAWAEYYGSDEVDELSRRWLASLRDKHELGLAREKFEEVAARLNASK